MNPALPCLIGLLLLSPAWAGFSVDESGGRIEVRDDGKLVFGWQAKPLDKPVGGEVFAASAFIHPLCTPSGFGLTTIQPDDHLHHFGIWWPWKKVTVAGKEHVTWEMQQLQGRHDAVSSKVVAAGAHAVGIESQNQTKIMIDGALKPVIDETVTMKISRPAADTYAVDIHITQQPVEGGEVTITKYRYSGFSWRGTGEWNKHNSVMRTSGGHDRDNANHQPAKWVSVDGATPTGRATLLMMSAAKEPELLRVWDSKQLEGTPFVNFNPVVKQPLVLGPEQKAVSDRRYRLIVADRLIEPAEADKLWREWMGE